MFLSEVEGALSSLVRMAPIGPLFPTVFKLNFDPSVILGVCRYVLTGHRVGLATDAIVDQDLWLLRGKGLSLGFAFGPSENRI